MATVEKMKMTKVERRGKSGGKRGDERGEEEIILVGKQSESKLKLPISNLPHWILDRLGEKKQKLTMSDSDAYSYEYDEDSAGGNEEASFEYTDDETSKQDDAVNIENTYYNAKASRDNGEFTEAIEGLESVVVMEVESIRKGSDDDGENCM